MDACLTPQDDFTLVIVAETIGATTRERGRPALAEGKMPSLPGLLRAEVRLLLSVKWPCLTPRAS